MIKLSNRLAAAAGFILSGARVADIGTDHGYIPVYLAQSGLASSIIASDIGRGPLDSARRSALEYGVAEHITFVLAPGLGGVMPGDADTIIIAGMGGETIIKILAGAPWTKEGGIRLILQPQSKTDELCLWLCTSGYAITDASLVGDGGRLYAIILCTGAEIPVNCDLPDILAKKRDPLLKEYLDGQIAKIRRAAEGLLSSGTRKSEYLCMTEKLERLSRLREETDKWSE